MSRTVHLLRCAVRLVLAGLTGNWDEYDRVCAEINILHAEQEND